MDKEIIIDESGATQRFVPVVCFECGRPLRNLQSEFENLLSFGFKAGIAADRLGITAHCCRSCMMNPCTYSRAKPLTRSTEIKDTGLVVDVEKGKQMKSVETGKILKTIVERFQDMPGRLYQDEYTG
jgi:DNA-directed RNA polymerase subunit N (RpoN/RPB10)